MVNTAVGIDLGTTHSCVSVYQHGKVEIIANDHGSKTTPSWVAFTSEERLVGDAARDQASLNTENTIYDMKRLIGRRYNDETVQSDIKNWPFTIVDINGFPQVEITSGDIERNFKPEEISAMVLTKMKETAEGYLETKINKAVVTVPAYFTNYQREATMKAAKLAGLEVIHLVNEPTAAAIAYASTKVDVIGTVLVFDLGGGTLDVSIVTVTDTHCIVKTTSGNTHLGGEDFSNTLLDHVINLFERKHHKQVRSNKRAMSRLKKECESAKKKLSFTVRARVHVDCLIDGIDCDEQITRAKFEELNADYFRSTLDPVSEALKSINMTKYDIDKVLMVGGSSRIPKIQNLLQQFFNNRSVYASINADEAIAYGAGIFAAISNGIDIKDTRSFIVQDIIPMALGIGIKKNCEKYLVIIEKNAAIPTSKTHRTQTLKDNQTAAWFPVYEGSDPKAKNNKFLGKFAIFDIPPRPKGQEKFDVTFIIDADGILTAYAKNVSTGKDARIVIDRKFKEYY